MFDLFPGEFPEALLSEKDPRKRVVAALDFANAKGVTPVIEVDDLLAKKIDSKCMTLYITMLFKAFNKTV